MYIKFLAAGGTIDKVYFDAKSDYKVGPPNIQAVLDGLSPGFEYTVESVLRKDSLDLTEQDRDAINAAVVKDKARKIVITHGTDTMVATARRLAGIKDKTVVLTGAMEPALFKTSDAVFNIGCAVAAVQTLPPGIYIAMNGRVFSHDRVRKNVRLGRFEAIDTDNRAARLAFHPLIKERWRDFEALFGKNGALGGCWCMWWRISRAAFDRQKGDGNRRAMKAIVASGTVPGILAYEDGIPVGWCSIAPRGQFASLNRSPVLKRIDERPVWSIVCFFVAKGHRGRGITRQLIQAGLLHAAAHGADMVEAYPAEPRDRKKLGAETVFMGLPGLFRSLGFRVAARPSPARTIMRYTIE